MRTLFFIVALIATLFGGLAALRLWVPSNAWVRDAWVLVGVLDDLSVLEVRMSVADTGLLARQLTTRLTLLIAGSSSLEHRAQWLGATLDDEGVHSAQDRLERLGEQWTMEMGEVDDVSARINLTDVQRDSCIPGHGTIGGFINDRVETRVGKGYAILNRIRAAGNVDDRALYVVGRNFRLAVDPLARCSAWWWTPEGSWSGPLPEMPPGKRFKLTLGPRVIQVRATGEQVVQEPFAHVLPAEQMVASWVGVRTPLHRLQRVEVRFSESERALGLLIIRSTR